MKFLLNFQRGGAETQREIKEKSPRLRVEKSNLSALLNLRARETSEALKSPTFAFIFMKKSLFFAAALLCGALPSVSRAQQIELPAPTAASKPAASLSEAELRALGEGIAFPYELLDKVLAANVNKEGAVFYSKVKGNNDLATFVRAVAIADLTKFPQWTIPADPADPKSKEQPDQTPEMAFWINAYNGLFLKTLADAYPISSPLQIKDLDTAKTRVVAGKSYSFAELRRKIAGIDPRALFSLPDGTNSGPRAAPAVVRYVGLSNRLNDAITAFVNDFSRVEAPQRLQKTVMVSPWLAEVDAFLKPQTTRRKWEGIRSILAAYTTRNGDQRYFSAGDYQVEFMLPNRSLNEQLSR